MMSKKRRQSVVDGQVDLLNMKQIIPVISGKKEETSIWKSVLQKSIRRGWTDKAMFAALKLLQLNWFDCWRRLMIISVEDCGLSDVIVATEILYREFMALRGRKVGCDLDWDMKRCAVCAAKILAESKKDRRADEFLEIIDEFEKGNFAELKADWESIPDIALDQHTEKGRLMGRGYQHWLEVSSKSINMTPQYKKWRGWFEVLLQRSVLLDKGKVAKE